jgi:hypothetical protein
VDSLREKAFVLETPKEWGLVNFLEICEGKVAVGSANGFIGILDMASGFSVIGTYFLGSGVLSLSVCDGLVLAVGEDGASFAFLIGERDRFEDELKREVKMRSLWAGREMIIGVDESSSVIIWKGMH